MFHFPASIASATKSAHRIHVVATEAQIKKGILAKVLDKPSQKLLAEAVKKPSAGRLGTTLKTFTGLKSPSEVWVSILPTKVSRHNSPTRKEWIYQQTNGLKSKDKKALIFVLDHEDHYAAAVAAVARHEQRVDYTTAKEKGKIGRVGVVAVDGSGEFIKANTVVKSVVDSVAWSASLLDQTPEDLNPKTYSAQIKEMFKGVKGVKITEIVGSKLVKEGLMGIHTVGRAAAEEPRMLVLEYKPKGAKKTIGIIGKGLTYDSGGLSLKPASAMFGMKMDMGGSSAVLGAFKVLVESETDKHIVCCVGLVENAIGPTAYRPDDVITMYSGKTVEINNTDAEGRLVLADCLAYVGQNYEPDLLINAATLTGAQMIATGMLHAGICATDEEVEKLAFETGLATGDMVMPMIFAPDILFEELTSPFADMRNSVKNRANAQSSCAGVFLYKHIEELNIPWLHIDLAGPAATTNHKGTGFGVHLISQIAEKY